MTEIVVAAQARAETGKNVNRRLRAQGLIPGTLYGASREARAVAVQPKLITAILRDQPAGNGNAEILRQSQSLTQKLISVEEHLTQLRTTGTGQDGVRWPAQVSERLRYLIGNTATGDYRPTDQTGEVHQVLKVELEEARKNLNAILSTDLPALNRLLQARNLPGIILDQH